MVKNKDKKIFLIVILICLIFLPTSRLLTTGTSANFLMQALHLVRGDKDWVGCYGTFGSHALKPPGYSILMAGVFKIAGISLESVFYATRFFYGLNVLVVFLLASALFGTGAGLISSIFIVSSYAINDAGTYLNYDVINPSLILLSIWIFIKQFRSNKLTYSFLSGVVLGSAYWIREFTLLFILLPWCIFLFKKEFGLKYVIKSIAAFYVSFAIVIAPWMIYVLNKGLGPLMILGGGSPESLGKVYGNSNMISLVINKEMFKGLAEYYRDYLKPNFIIAPLMVIAWLYTMALSIIKRNRNVIFLGICGALCLPLLIFLGKTGERLGQAVIFFDLSFIAVAFMLVNAAGLISSKAVILRRKRVQILAITLLAVLAAVSLIVSPKIRKRTKARVTAIKSFYVDGRFKMEGRLNPYVKDACEWLVANLPKGDIVYVDGGIWETFDFFTRLNFDKRSMEINGGWYNLATDTVKASALKGGDIIGFWPSMSINMNTKSKYDRYRKVEFITKEPMYDLLQKAIDAHVVVSNRNNFIGYYLERMGAVLKYKNREVRIYSGLKDPLGLRNEVSLITGDSFVSIIPWLKETYPDEYGDFEDFLGRQNLTYDDLLENTYKKHQKDWITQNIPMGSKIALSCCCEVKDFFITDFQSKLCNQDKPLSWFKERYDFLIIHWCMRYYNSLPGLFEDIEGEDAVIWFPNSPYLGEGSGEVYKLKSE
ncbi:MAG: glycosyltransferase family 39 protein [Candidatus Omnitrophica bacterium]|nr:glycosyltransferase family 39 protein [Candidatus Omnitrophota bacterium]